MVPLLSGLTRRVSRPGLATNAVKLFLRGHSVESLALLKRLPVGGVRNARPPAITSGSSPRWGMDSPEDGP